MLQILEEENSNVTWAEWTPAKLNSKKSKELQVSNKIENEEPLLLEDIETVLAQSHKENCNPAVTNSSSKPNLKRKKSKQLEVNAAKRNERIL